MYQGVLDTIGSTPVVCLKRILPTCNFSVFCKLEFFNPSGSAKDRSGYSIISNAIEKNEINKDTVVVESSSGNFGISLAQICCYFGLKFICVVDKKTTAQNIKLLKAYGAEIDMVEQPDKESGEYLHARIARVKQLVKENSNSYWPNQYHNSNNPIGHQKTISELRNQIRGNIDYIFCAVSTCGTLHGYSDYINNNGMNTKLIAVDAVGSVIFDELKCYRMIPGHGAAIVPDLFSIGIYNDYVLVNDEECIIGCRKLLKNEAILAGGSTGAIVSAVIKYADRIASQSNVVIIAHDKGDRYLDTIYSDSWVNKHFNNLASRLN